jgi:hypothetical protein
MNLFKKLIAKEEKKNVEEDFALVFKFVSWDRAFLRSLSN